MRRGPLLILALGLSLALLLSMPAVYAYIGVSGDFYAHTYTVPIGGTVSGSTVVIYNPSNETIHVRMIYQVKPETELLKVNFSETEFILKPGERKVVYVTLIAAPNCPPGNYTVIVGGEEIKQVGNESVAAPSGALKATVIVSGAGASVKVVTVDINGNPVPTSLVLLSLPSKYPIKRSETGVIEARVAPGDYRAEAYLAGQLLNATEFHVGPNEEKTIKLVVRTVYFLSFNVVPAKDSEGRIGYAYIVATVRNLFKPLPNAKVVLRVYKDGEHLEDVEVSTLPQLPLNDTEFKYNYIPQGGWKSGDYAFQMLLYSGNVLYAKTQVEHLKVGAGGIAGGAPSPTEVPSGKGFNWVYALVPVVLVLIAVLALRRRSPVKIVGLELRGKELIVRVKNNSKRDALLVGLKILALPSRVVVKDVRKPFLKGGARKLGAGSTGEIVIPDEDGSVHEAVEAGGIVVVVETNIGSAEAEFSG